ncbi:conserved hypothetical protein [Theileria orientalis strain Shintoku]|uniref:Uncharacterized protein n=1 Tax=Theileria orientalis strain Shintoku TaxID=869250 RepID=J4DPM3_THEOR|nr:conserved hypothetical protein [Theileria orientalis strain Shintoku]BAM40954.1 conserved hypothetical protein [Theileria orientalis strain Shintoku]|eukprot:XP_009691255.1 conserved hypothetical protein [Theileria orientalis strain Shintoku]
MDTDFRTMKLLNNTLINYNIFGIHQRYFSRNSRKRVTTTYSGLTDEEINAKIRELQMLKSNNIQTIQRTSVWSRIFDGILHGIGWSFAGRIVDSIFGPRSLNITPNQPDNTPLDHQNTAANSEGFSSNISDNLSDNFTDNSESGGQGWSWIAEKLLDDE